MSCKTVQERMLAFAYDALPVEQADHMVEHVDSCGDCAVELEQWRGRTDYLDSWTEVAPPSNLHRRTLERVMSPSAEPWVASKA